MLYIRPSPMITCGTKRFFSKNLKDNQFSMVGTIIIQIKHTSTQKKRMISLFHQKI